MVWVQGKAQGNKGNQDKKMPQRLSQHQRPPSSPHSHSEEIEVSRVVLSTSSSRQLEDSHSHLDGLYAEQTSSPSPYLIISFALRPGEGGPHQFSLMMCML